MPCHSDCLLLAATRTQGGENLFPTDNCELFARNRTALDTDVDVTGLSVPDSFDTELNIQRTSDRFHIVLGHSPDFALGNIDADLLVAGHTHGGQVRLPFLGPLLTMSHVPRKWASGLTELAEGKTLIVSRGIGMERRDAPRVRFLCRPQLVFVRITPRK